MGEKNGGTVGRIPEYVLKTQHLYITGVVLVITIETEMEEAKGTFSKSLEMLSSEVDVSYSSVSPDDIFDTAIS